MKVARKQAKISTRVETVVGASGSTLLDYWRNDSCSGSGHERADWIWVIVESRSDSAVKNHIVN